MSLPLHLYIRFFLRQGPDKFAAKELSSDAERARFQERMDLFSDGSDDNDSSSSSSGGGGGRGVGVVPMATMTQIATALLTLEPLKDARDEEPIGEGAWVVTTNRRLAYDREANEEGGEGVARER